MNRLLKHPAISIVLVCAIIGSCCFNGIFADSGGVMGGNSFFSDPELSYPSSSYTPGQTIVIFVFVIVLIFLARFVIYYFGEGGCSHRQTMSAHSAKPLISSSTIIRLHVALDGTQRFQRDLNEIAARADTSTRKGFRNILTKSSLFLTRRSDKWASSHLSVTILVAALGVLNLPSIENHADLKTVLEEFMSISEKDILAVQVLWTPQEENEVISSEKINQDYPLLNSF